MNFKHLLLLPLGVLATAALAAPGVGADPAAAARVQAHVQFLADDLLEGRGTGTRGHEIAAAYVASQFRAMGLEPGGENGSWYQWVPLRRATLVPGKTSIAMTLDGKSAPVSEYELGLSPSLAARSRAIDAGMVFVGYGLVDKRMGLDDYAGLDVRGKIVVALRGTPEGLPSDIAAHIGSTKGALAAQRGAVGMLVIPARAPATAPSNPPRSLYSNARSTDWIDGAGKPGSDPIGVAVDLSASRAMAERLFAGATRSLADVRAEAAKSGARPRGFALRPVLSIRSESAWEDFRSPEVIGRLPGVDSALKAEHIVLMGHLDHIGIKADAKPGEDRIYNGAIDNAAGVSTLLEAARQFSTSGRPPRRSLLFVANTGEELGLLGAGYFAAHPTVPIGQIAGLVDLDMPIPLYEFNDVTAFGAAHSTVAKNVASAAAELGIKVSPDPMPAEAIFVRSDHYRFVEKGVPAILLMTGYGNGGEAVWKGWFNTVYHGLKDDLNQPFKWTALARYADLNYRIARQLADADSRPRWYQGNYFGDLFAPGAPRAPAAK